VGRSGYKIKKGSRNGLGGGRILASERYSFQVRILSRNLDGVEPGKGMWEGH